MSPLRSTCASWRRPRGWALALLLALLLALASSACEQQAAVEPPAQDPACDCGMGQPVVDPGLLAFLSKAKAVHQQADIAEDQGEGLKAASLLDQLLSGPRPGGDTSLPEVREVLADTLARKAGLLSTAGQLEQASAAVERGLELAIERSHYRGRLMEVLGGIEQRRHDELREAGDEAGAERAKARAIKALEEAVAIQDEVIRSVLGEGGSGSATP